MSDRLYAYVPIKEYPNDVEQLFPMIQKLCPESTVTLVGNKIDISGKNYPIWICSSDELVNNWEIFVWCYHTWIYSDKEEDVMNKLLLQDICRVLGSEECWYGSELVIEDYALDNFCTGEWSDLDLSKYCIEHADYVSDLFDIKQWNIKKRPFIHYSFKDNR